MSYIGETFEKAVYVSFAKTDFHRNEKRHKFYNKEMVAY